jgi:uncharacterized protein
MIVVDTNVLLYAVNRSSPLHATAQRALEEVVNGGGPWAITWPIVYEFLRVATHPKVFPKPLPMDDVLEVLVNLLQSPSARLLTETEEHLPLMASCRKEVPRLKGNLLHDFHTAVLMREHAAKEILTFDQDFKAFPWVKVSMPDPAGGQA